MKALGIIAMIVAVLSIIIPVAGTYITVLAAILAAFAAGEGLTFGAVAIGLNIINIIFLSPLIWVTEAGMVGSWPWLVISLVGIQIIAGIILIVYHKAYMKKKSAASGNS